MQHDSSIIQTASEYASPAAFVFRLIYTSTSRLEQTDAGLRTLHELLTTARQRNAENDVTGVLYYDGRKFTQLLEGPPDAVEAIFKRIAADSRHERVAVKSRTMWPHRSFAGWKMALVAAKDRLEALGEEGDITDDVDRFVSVMQAVLAE